MYTYNMEDKPKALEGAAILRALAVYLEVEPRDLEGALLYICHAKKKTARRNQS